MAKKIKTIKAEPIKKSNAKIKSENLPVKATANIQSMSNMPMNVVDLNPQQLIALAIQNNSAVEVMEQLYAFSEKVNADRAKKEYFKALSEFQKSCPIIRKTKTVLNKDGKTTRYKYAPLDSITKQVKSILERFGFSYTFQQEKVENGVKVTCITRHSAGHSESASFTAEIDEEAYMNHPQKFASAHTFASRYAFCAAFGITTGDDDDANAFDLAKSDLLKEVKIKISDKILSLHRPDFQFNAAKEKTDILGMAQSIRRSLNPDEIKYFQNLRDDKKEFTMDGLKKELLNLSEIIDAEMKKAEENSKMDNEKKSLIAELDGVLVICRKDIRDFNQAKELSIKTNFIPESDIKLSSKENIRKLVEHLKDMVLNNEANKNKS
jgi:hypothetical protein